MIKIKDILSIKERRAILLEDDDSNFGGVAFEGEALQDIIEDDGKVYFTEEENSLGINVQKKHQTLTALCHGDDFSMSEINIDYKPINEFLYLLDRSNQNDFEEVLAEAHCEFW